MRVIIAGPRNLDDYRAVVAAIHASGFEITEVVSGKATGIDTCGEHWAKRNGIPIKGFPADWHNLSYPNAIIKTNRHGRQYDAKAGIRRNEQMADYADALIAVQRKVRPGRGTQSMINIAQKKGLKVYVHYV